jgi:hypothetical protein
LELKWSRAFGASLNLLTDAPANQESSGEVSILLEVLILESIRKIPEQG